MTLEEAIAIMEDPEKHEMICSHDELLCWLKELQELRSAPTLEWISCDDELPPEDSLVIVCVYGSDLIIPMDGETIEEAILRNRQGASVTLGFIGSDGWYGSEWAPMMVSPSFWAKIPKPPKDGDPE